ncbi:MAG: exosortase/archaeosortase family protein [Kiritimatiellia bacterium]|nr:exosortase/archaeosortase family protein [Kiritimatiellia bacterium]
MIACGIIGLAALIHYRAMFVATAAMFAEPLEDMSHGWLVPVFSLYVLWRQRNALRAAAGRPDGAGAGWVALFLVIAWFGSRGGQSRMEQVSFIGLVWSVPYALWGRRVERLMRFPAAFLFFAVPLSSFLDFFTIHLRLVTSVLATGILNGLGLAVERSGTALFSRVPGGTFNVDVADPCSGIRSLFALMALTAAYAYFTRKGLWRKWALFACSLPIAMIGNMVRIMSICLIARWFGQETATGFYHDYSGYVVFLVGVLLMVQAGEWIGKGEGKGNAERRTPNAEHEKGKEGENVERSPLTVQRSSEEGEENAERRMPNAERRSGGGAWVVCGVCVAVLAVFAANRAMPPPVYDDAAFVAKTLPERVGGFTGWRPLFCHNPQCLQGIEARAGLSETKPVQRCPGCGGELFPISLGEASELPSDTVILKRTYRSVDGVSYAVSVVLGGRSRNSIHRAELCLPAQGYVMLDAERLVLRLVGRAPLRVRSLRAARRGGGEVQLLYWFMSRERESCSHTERILFDVWDRSFHNRINRWVMVAVNAASGLAAPEQVEGFEAFLSELYPALMVGR